MATTKFYLDTRNLVAGKTAPLKLAVTQKGKTALIHLNIQLLPTQWDNRAGKVIGHPNKFTLNTYIGKRKQDIDNVILKLTEKGEIMRMNVTEIKKRIAEELSPNIPQNKDLFNNRFLVFAQSKKDSTKKIYMHTYNRLLAYYGEDFETLSFEDITKEWLTAFDTFLQKTSPSKNARNIHLRNIRAVFNEAIDDGVTTAYPFRRFKIRPVATPKRAFNVEQLRQLFDYPVEGHTVKYLDMFKLIFFLIGINIIDLCKLVEIRNGRIEYYRSKTNRLYSIKVEPEAMKIIEKYRGYDYLLDIMDRYRNHKDYAKRLNENLQRIGEVNRIGRGGKKMFSPAFPNITTYWARHSWATIAASLEIPKETIAAALGHGGNTVTDIYIDFDRKKVDEANRRVIDWVLYGKK
jgi:tyrosine type site-specific recombinase